MTDPILTLENLAKRFTADGPPAVDGVSLDVGTGEVVAILGPSGCGKSTLLAMVAGLEAPDAGRVLWQGRDITRLETHRRDIGLVFQDYALFPHRDVAANVAFGLEMRNLPATDIEARVHWALDLVGLTGFDHRDVNLLSGGEQQRVALARTLAPRPALVLLDEPLGALDRLLREQLLEALGDSLRQAGQTTLYVTHDQEEAFAVADRVAVMRAGRFEQVDTPAAVYTRPANRWAAEFLGFTNLLGVALVPVEEGRWAAEADVGRFVLDASSISAGAVGLGTSGSVTAGWSDGSSDTAKGGGGHPEHRTATLLIRPEGARQVSPRSDEGPESTPTGSVLEGTVLNGTVLKRTFRGRRQVVDVDVGGTRLRFEFRAAEALPAVGEAIALEIAPSALQVLSER